MEERAAAGSDGSRAAALAAVAPWRATLEDLRCWFESHAGSVWPGAGPARSRQVLALLQETLDSLARGEEAIAPAPKVPPAAADPQRIDALLAGTRRPRRSPAAVQAAQRRGALLDLALWGALRRLGAHADGASRPPTLAQLHTWLARPTPPAPGVSPAPEYALSRPARDFFDTSVRGVLELLARKLDGQGAQYTGQVPAQPFDPGLPSLVAWSQAWSVAVAGVYLDNLRRHANDDLQQALVDIWSGRLEAVRFRTGPGLTALPAREGSLHFDLWTCAVKAQALAFDRRRWAAQAAGARWHGVRIDMHDLSGAGDAAARGLAGLGVEALYRTVFVDRLHAVLDGGLGADHGTGRGPDGGGEHTIAIDMDRPRNGQLPNLRLVLRWRDPQGGPPRFVASGTEPAMTDPQREALARWLAAQGGEALARPLDPALVDWHGALPDEAAADAGSGLLDLGDASLWHAFGPAVQWIDAALVVCVGGAWYELPVELHDVAGGEGAAARTQWSLPAGATLPAGLDVETLRHALRDPATLQWAAHEEGLGAFVMAAVDVDAWQRSRRS